MSSAAVRRPRLRFDASPHGVGSLIACCLPPDLAAALASTTRPSELLKSTFRVTVAQEPLRQIDDLPDVSGDYVLGDDEVRFIPTFPFDSDVKYRVIFGESGSAERFQTGTGSKSLMPGFTLSICSRQIKNTKKPMIQ